MKFILFFAIENFKYFIGTNIILRNFLKQVYYAEMEKFHERIIP